MDEIDLILGDKLGGVLSVSGLIEVRNEFELRVANYFQQNIA